MKKTGLLIAAVILMASCSKDDVEPVTGYNSHIQFDGIQIYNLLIADSVKGFVDFQFIVTDSTQQNDTVSFKYNYKLNQLVSDQTVHFNTPANTTKANFKLQFVVYAGDADSVHIDNWSYIRNNATLLSTPVYFNDTLIPGTFRAPTISYSF